MSAPTADDQAAWVSSYVRQLDHAIGAMPIDIDTTDAVRTLQVARATFETVRVSDGMKLELERARAQNKNLREALAQFYRRELRGDEAAVDFAVSTRARGEQL